MKDFFLKQIDNNHSIVIYILTLKDKRYDLFFKMVGGQNGPNYRKLKDIKNRYIELKNGNTMNGWQAVLNPDGTICKNHYLVAISLLTDLHLEFISKTIAPSPLWDTGIKWLNEIFTPEEVTTILNEKQKWIQKIK